MEEDQVLGHLVSGMGIRNAFYRSCIPIRKFYLNVLVGKDLNLDHYLTFVMFIYVTLHVRMNNMVKNHVNVFHRTILALVAWNMNC